MDHSVLRCAIIIFGAFSCILPSTSPLCAQTPSKLEEFLPANAPRLDSASSEPEKKELSPTSDIPIPKEEIAQRTADKVPYLAPLALMGSAGGGLLISLSYLLTTFREQRGFRIIRNRWSALFLIFGAVNAGLLAQIAPMFVSAVQHMFQHSILTWNETLVASPFVASPLGGRLIPLIGRFFRRSKPQTATQTKDFKELAVTGFLVAKIWDNISCQIRFEVSILAMKLDGAAIREVTQNLIDSEVLIKRITRDEGTEVIEAVDKIIPRDEPNLDTPAHRDKALKRVLDVAPFSLLRSFALSEVARAQA
jgi:hypothetical protein